MALIGKGAPAPPNLSSPASQPNQTAESAQERVSSAFHRLMQSATTLNAVSDELGKPVAAIEAALKRLNLGVSTWVQCAGAMDDATTDYWSRDLGYAKVSGRWGIAIRYSVGCYADGESNDEHWLFNDAPRSYRLEAADKIPELLEALVKTSDETANKLKQKIDGVREVARTVATVLSANTAAKK